MIVGGYPSRQQEERRQTPRFAVEDIVHENGYDMEKAGRMMEMIEEKEDWHGEDLTLRLKVPLGKSHAGCMGRAGERKNQRQGIRGQGRKGQNGIWKL